MNSTEVAAKAIIDMQEKAAMRIMNSATQFNTEYFVFNELLKTKGRLWLMLNRDKIKAFACLDGLRFSALKYCYVVEQRLNSRREKGLGYMLDLNEQRSNLEICFGVEKTKQLFELLGFSLIKGRYEYSNLG